jgi:ubiquinone/menaquinone biosynthesis C-methylase UbiE
MSGERQPFFDSLSERWDCVYADTNVRTREWVATQPLPKNTRTVLDVGCGTGVSSHEWAKRLGTGGTVIAVDNSPGMVHYARHTRNHERVLWVCGEAQKLPVSDGSVDAIMALHMWPHLDDKDATVREWFRVLRPGGMLHIVHLSSRATINAIHHHGDEPVKEDRLPSADDLAVFVAGHGFMVEEIEDGESRYRIGGMKPGDGTGR